MYEIEEQRPYVEKTAEAKRDFLGTTDGERRSFLQKMLVADFMPSRTTKNHAASNLRADQGSPYTNDPDTYSVNVQPNTNASNSSVRKFTAKP